jgi:hypothetical protein
MLFTLIPLFVSVSCSTEQWECIFSIYFCLTLDFAVRVSESFKKIRNTMRFMLGNTYDFKDPENVVPYDNLSEVCFLSLYSH